MKSILYFTGLVLLTASHPLFAQTALPDLNDGAKGESKLFRRIDTGGSPEKKEVSWLGVGVEEATEALDAQLGLKPGEGLVVTMVASNSPAAKAELRKFDVLAEFEGQMLVDPMQLRKLVQMHAEGETVNLVVYRGGKKLSVSPTLAKTSWDDSLLDDGGRKDGNYWNFNFPKWDNFGRQIRAQAQAATTSADEAKAALLQYIPAEKAKADREMKRAMDEARRALERALREHPARTSTLLGSEDKDLKDLADGGVDLNLDATVVVSKDSNSAKSMVKTDETGDYIVIADPNRRLTAHDHNGKLLFDGAIETPEEQDKVPREVWEKVKPMLDQMGTIKRDKTQTKTAVNKSDS